MSEDGRRPGYWTTQEAVAHGWWKPLLYQLRRSGTIQVYKFPRDARSYWKIEELLEIENGPPRPRPPR